MIAIVSFAYAILLLVWDWKTGSYLILPTVVGIDLILFGPRFLYSNTARRDRTQEQGRRLENHLRCGKVSSGQSEDR
jgi:hypothetical protein